MGEEETDGDSRENFWLFSFFAARETSLKRKRITGSSRRVAHI